MSHRTADVSVRERLAPTPDEMTALLERERAAGRAVVVLATCNRFELYWWGEHDNEPWLRARAAARGVGAPELAAASERRDGFAAVRHLFRVAAGLESQVLGEAEILGQVRRAFDQARAAGTTTRTVDAVFSTALAAGRRVRSGTTLGRHPVSVSAAAVRHARAAWGGTLAGRRVTVVGAGEAAEGVLRALSEAGVRGAAGGAGAACVTVVNRDPARARALAEAWGVGDVRPWDALAAAVVEADLVVAATAASHAVLTRELVAEAQTRRAHRPLLVLDLCVPRNVAPEAAEVAGVELVDLDGLQARYCPADAQASDVLVAADRILADELARLDVRLRAQAAAPRLAELHRQSAAFAEEELHRTFAELPSLGEAERDVLRRMAQRLVQRVMYPVSRAVRAGETEGGTAGDSVPR
ncbi:MAG TPA: glutamyl-tRNA reductase [Gemmatimonadales bacterium]|nr:glutamyl-tRNA reductase [Gemmatimonadales bacterium]